MKTNATAHKRMGAVLGLLLLMAVVGILLAQETLPVETATTEPYGDEPHATPLSLMPPYREISDGGKSPALSFIESPSATCSRPVPGTGACYIRWEYLYVTASSGSYIISMTVAIDDHIRGYHAGFFQTSMYIPADMIAPGYQVTCGLPGSDGIDGWGQQYSYVIRARESSGSSAANYGLVTCPADAVRIFLPYVKK